MRLDDAGRPVVHLADEPHLVGRVDGLKIESVAVRPADDGGVTVFVGTDDENYGATIRQLP